MNEDSSDKGVIYVAFGYEYLIMALNSFRTLKRQHPDLPATLVTNIPFQNTPDANVKQILDLPNSNSIFDTVHVIDDKNENNRWYKTSVIEYSPYEKTLFIDVDTEIQSSIRHGFEFLEYFDVAFTFAPYPITTMVNEWEGDAHLEHLALENACRWNSAVFFFDKSNDTKVFFNRWRDTYEQFGYEADQFSLINSIYNSPVRIMSLDLSWNANTTTMRFDKSIQSDLKIHHYSKRLWKLRELECEIGNRVLNSDGHLNIHEVREEFQSKYSYMNELKKKIKAPKFSKILARFQ